MALRGAAIGGDSRAGFGEGEAKKQVLFDVDLAVERGKLTILLGPSGSGKTTLLTLLGCLRRLQSGSVRLLGSELLGADEASMVQSRRRLGFIFQAHNLHESLTATQNVRMGLEVHGKDGGQKQRTHGGRVNEVDLRVDQHQRDAGAVADGGRERRAVPSASPSARSSGTPTSSSPTSPPRRSTGRAR